MGFYVLQKLFLVGLAVIAAVNADVSHLFNKGYNYQQPSQSFSDQLSLPLPPAPAPAPAPLPVPAPAPQVRSPKETD